MRRPEPTRREPFETWKPDRCEAPGCNQPHPSLSKTGTKGPWLCREHYVSAAGLDKPPLHESIEIEKLPEKSDRPPSGRLL